MFRRQTEVTETFKLSSTYLSESKMCDQMCDSNLSAVSRRPEQDHWWTRFQNQTSGKKKYIRIRNEHLNLSNLIYVWMKNLKQQVKLRDEKRFRMMVRSLLQVLNIQLLQPTLYCEIIDRVQRFFSLVAALISSFLKDMAKQMQYKPKTQFNRLRRSNNLTENQPAGLPWRAGCTSLQEEDAKLQFRLHSARQWIPN